MVTQCHAYLFGMQQALAMQIVPADKYYVCLPLFHVFGMTCAMNTAIAAGAGLSLMMAVAPRSIAAAVRA